MYVDWTKHLQSKQEKEDFERSVLGSRRVLERLKALIEERETALDRSELDPKSFENPSWAYLQAFKNGSRSAYNTIKRLIDLDQQQLPTKE